MTPEQKAAFQNILDCFSGLDGGGSFIAVRTFLEACSGKEEAGFKKAIECLMQFSRLVTLAEEIQFGKRQ